MAMYYVGYDSMCVCVHEVCKEREGGGGGRERRLHVLYPTGLLKDVRKMTTPQLEEIKSHLTQPHLEVACTLVYADHSTQLRNRKVFNQLC